LFSLFGTLFIPIDISRSFNPNCLSFHVLKLMKNANLYKMLILEFVPESSFFGCENIMD
jgi:hypothetical protein